MATIDSNGVLFYQDTDNYTPIQTALNLAQSNLSNLLSGKPRFERVANTAARAALVTSIGAGNISKANPLLVWRADAADGLQLEYTTNGSTWRTIADKEYYDSQDTGWVDVPLASGFTATAPVQVRRIGKVVYWRGRVSRTAGAFPLGTVQTVASDGNVPTFARVPTSWSNSASVISNDSVGLAYSAITGSAALAITALNVASNNYYLKGLSGYTSD